MEVLLAIHLLCFLGVQHRNLLAPQVLGPIETFVSWAGVDPLVFLALQNSLEIGQGLADPADVMLGHREIQFVVYDAFVVQGLVNAAGNLDGTSSVVMG